MAFSHQTVNPSLASFIKKMESGDTVVTHTSLTPAIATLQGSADGEYDDTRELNSGDLE